MTLHDQQQRALEEFSQIWAGYPGTKEYATQGLDDRIKSFISSLLATTREEERAKYENCPQCTGLGEQMVRDERERVKKVVEGMQQARSVYEVNVFTANYDTALRDVLTTLSSDSVKEV